MAHYKAQQFQQKRTLLRRQDYGFASIEVVYDKAIGFRLQQKDLPPLCGRPLTSLPWSSKLITLDLPRSPRSSGQ